MLRQVFKKLLDTITHPLGLNVIPYFGKDIGLKQVNQIFRKKGINLILDIGANSGQYACSIIESGYTGKLVSFEPQVEAFDELTKNAKRYPNWDVYNRCAIGDYDGDTVINISKNSHSSSILPINDLHTRAAPSAEYSGLQAAPIYTIDSIADKIITDNSKICLKIDTQGYEDRVITGAIKTLNNVQLIQLELSLMPLYDGSKPFEWMVPFLKNLNFEPIMYLPGFIDRTTDQIQQIEGLFMKMI